MMASLELRFVCPFSTQLQLCLHQIAFVWSECSFLSFWAGLQPGENQDMLKNGADIFKETALHYHRQGETKDHGLALISTGGAMACWSLSNESVRCNLFAVISSCLYSASREKLQPQRLHLQPNRPNVVCFSFGH